MDLYRNTLGIFGIVIVLGSFCIAQPPPGDLLAGHAVFINKCKICHGEAGEGNPAIARALKTTQPVLYAGTVQNKSDADLRRIIALGTGKMKPVAGLGDADFDNVITFIRTLKQR